MKTKYWGEKCWDKNRGGVIMCPGFLSYKEEKMWVDLGTRLENIGVGSVAWDPSGYGEEMAKMNEFYKPTNWVKDLKDLVDSMEDRGIEKEKLILVGNSMGGVIAADFGSKHSIAGLVIISSPYQVGTEDDLTKELKEWEEEGKKKFVSSKWGDIWVSFDFMKDAKKYNVLKFAKKIKCPKLIIAGDKDSTVSPGATKKIYDECTDPKQWKLIKGMAHKYKNDPVILDKVNGLIADFVRNTNALGSSHK